MGVTKKSELIGDKRLQIIRNGCVAPTRTWTSISLGFENNMGVFNNDVNVVSCALLERYYNCEITPGIFEPPLKPGVLAFVGPKFDTFSSKVARYCKPRTRVLSLDEVVDLYRGPKFRTYSNARDSIMNVPVNKRDAMLSGFSKFEKCNLDKACRMINPRNPRYNVELARYLKQLEKTVYAAINQLFKGYAPTVLKGYNAVVVAQHLRCKWNRFAKPAARGIDAKKFDMHVSEKALKYEHGIYNKIFNSKKLLRLLRWQRRNVGIAFTKDGLIKYKIKGTRSSGDINTSLGNVIIMTCLIFVFLDGKCEFELGNNGDDCVVITEEDDIHHLDGFADWAIEHGFRMEVEPIVRVFEQISFCQTNPVFNGVEYVMCRNPFTVFVKDTMCIHPCDSEFELRRWLYAVGDCGLSIHSGIPVLQSFYMNYKTIGLPFKNDKLVRQYFRNEGRLTAARGLISNYRAVTEDARYSFYLAFNVLPDIQRDLEHGYDIDYSDECAIPHTLYTNQLIRGWFGRK